MSKITVTLPVDEALFVLAALDHHSADAHATARRLRNLGENEEAFAVQVAHTTAIKSDAARKRIADVLYPMDEPTLTSLRRDDIADEIEFGLI